MKWIFSFFEKVKLFAVLSVALFLSGTLLCEEVYDVYLCVGQSNMAGRGLMIESDKQAIDGVWLLDENGGVEQATNPLNRYSTIRKDISMQQIGPACEFAVKMHAQSGHKILLVVNARGGTGLSSWMKDASRMANASNYFDEAVRRTVQALQYGQLKGIIWHQGESDGSTPEGYAEKLTCFVDDLRTALNTPDVPFVAGEVARWLPYGQAINGQLHRAAEKVAKCGCVSSEGCGMLSNENDPHFSREGAILIGERYAQMMMQLQR